MSTIAAISTPYGTGGISVVRVSGPDSINIAQKVFKSHDGFLLKDMQGYTSKLGYVFYKGNPIDEVIASVFKSPRSYTGEDMVQLSCHGGMYITKSVLRSLLDSGAVMADRGEFTRRAFMNGKISLEKAESVMGLISSRYEMERRINFSSYNGSLKSKINSIKDMFVDLLARLNAEIDYSEEDIPEVNDNEIISIVDSAESQVKSLIDSYSTGYIIQNGVRTAIIGSPNVGKSTLMNLLAHREKSIVTDIAGTTRDAIEETIILGNIPLILVDTAGIRESNDIIEQIGAKKSREIADSANLILFLIDASRKISDDELALLNSFDKKRVIIVVNKIDLNPDYDSSFIDNDKIVYISAKNGEGLQQLSDSIEKFVDFGSCDENDLIITTERQRDVLVKCLEKVEIVKSNVGKVTKDILVELLKDPVNVLSEFSGEKVEDEVVDSIFSKFCVGK